MGLEPKRYHHMAPVGSVCHHCIDSWAGDPVVQLLSCVQLFLTPWTIAGQASLSFTISEVWFKLMSIESVMLFNHLILCRSLLLLGSWLFASRGLSIEASASVSVLPVNIQG